jgi:hypothetical protein
MRSTILLRRSDHSMSGLKTLISKHESTRQIIASSAIDDSTSLNQNQRHTGIVSLQPSGAARLSIGQSVRERGQFGEFAAEGVDGGTEVTGRVRV